MFVFFLCFFENKSCFAAEQLTVNSVSVSKGDIVNYSFYMSDVTDKVEALGAFIYYDSDYLEYIDDSIGFDVLKNAMTNITEDQIYYCAIDVEDGFDFENEGLVVTASFKVLDTASGSEMIINHFDEIFTFENEDVDSLGGFLLDRFGNFPVQGQSIVVDGWRFTIAEMGEHRINIVTIQKVGA